MKKKLALLLSTILAVGMFAACSSSSASTASTSTAGSTAQTASELQVDVFYYDFSDVYISTVRAAMDKQLKAMGIEPKN